LRYSKHSQDQLKLTHLTAGASERTHRNDVKEHPGNKNPAQCRKAKSVLARLPKSGIVLSRKLKKSNRTLKASFYTGYQHAQFEVNRICCQLLFSLKARADLGCQLFPSRGNSTHGWARCHFAIGHE
jgi:hypothetical protein